MGPDKGYPFKLPSVLHCLQCFDAVGWVAGRASGKAFQFAIRIDSIRYANRFESILFVKNQPFDSLVVMQFFLLIYCHSQFFSLAESAINLS